MQLSRQRASPFSFLAGRPPVSFQGSPHRLPILRRGFHHDLIHFPFQQPFGQQSQMLGASAKTPPFKLVLAFHLHVGHHHSQHLFMHVDSRYPISHKLLLAGAESVPRVTFSRVTGYRRSRLERGNAQLFAQLRTLPIRHTNSLDRSSGDSTSSLPPLPILPDTRSNFHELLRAAGPRRHTTRVTRSRRPRRLGGEMSSTRPANPH